MISPRVPDLAALDVLITVVRAGSFNAAAAELGISQQAVSWRIRAIENQVGVPLLHRGARGSILTAQGVLVAEWASRVLDAAEEFGTGLASLRQDRAHHLRIAASLTIAEHLLPGWLVAFRDWQTSRGEAASQVSLQAVNSETVGAQIRSGAADIGFVEGHRPPEGVRSKVVSRDQLVVVVHPNHPWARLRRPLRAAELAGMPLVAREAGSGTRNALAAALPAKTVQVEPAMELSTSSAVRSAVLLGAGPAVISRLAVRDDLALGRLAGVQVDGLDLRRELRAVWIGGSTPPAGPARDLVGLAARAGESPADRI